ncbi:hypothetical protein [Bordetella petrii]|uniref:hypothetical protein n=1 Tax=Bordetella petrii TaxID=94624 RepID=UPI001E33EE84|nr:hypothetical protein [Bordetella petrii]MCD0505058.1 hypothetical protein [Bordetella petrii]
MANGLYPEAVQRVKQACIDFLAGTASIEHTQATLHAAEQTIVALDEKWLRALLFEAENKLEEIRFTVPDEQQAAQARAALAKVLQALPAPPMDVRELMAASRAIARHNVTDNVLAVAVAWDETASQVTVAYYVDGPPRDDERELCELTLAELLAQFPAIRQARTQCVDAGNKGAALRSLPGLAYLR